MRAPIFRSPIVLASAALAAGLIVKWGLSVEFAVGGTMVLVLWVLPLIGVAITSDEFFPGGWGSESEQPAFFSSRENRLEFLALLSLPGLGFALDTTSSVFAASAFAAVGLVGVIACAKLVRLERDKRIVGA
jgi:hypothetical protein